LSSQQLAQIIPFVFIFIIFYFVLIRPGTTRQKKLQQMIDNLKVGDKIVTVRNLRETTLYQLPAKSTPAASSPRGATSTSPSARPIGMGRENECRGCCSSETEHRDQAREVALAFRQDRSFFGLPDCGGLDRLRANP
jgi:hypothetical protein